MTYSLSAWGPEGETGEELAFAVDPATGEVSVAGQLDRERRTAHHLLVTATDGGRPQLLTTAHLFITGVYPRSYARLRASRTRFDTFSF